MATKRVHFPAVIDKDPDSDYSVLFPDFPGCAGRPLDEAVLGAHEALAGHVALMVADGDELPEPTSLEEVAAQRDASTVAITLVPVTLPGKAQRVNITIDEGLLDEIDAIADNRSAERDALSLRGAEQGELGEDNSSAALDPGAPCHLQNPRAPDDGVAGTTELVPTYRASRARSNAGPQRWGLPQ